MNVVIVCGWYQTRRLLYIEKERPKRRFIAKVPMHRPAALNTCWGLVERKRKNLVGRSK
jgi:hypothetical protein